MIDCTNYRSIPFSLNIEKVIEKLMYKRLSNIVDINNMIYSLQFDLTQKPFGYSCLG